MQVYVFDRSLSSELISTVKIFCCIHRYGSDDAETIYYSRFHCQNTIWKQSKTKPELYDVQVPSLTGRLIHNLECSPVNIPL